MCVCSLYVLVVCVLVSGYTYKYSMHLYSLTYYYAYYVDIIHVVLKLQRAEELDIVQLSTRVLCTHLTYVHTHKCAELCLVTGCITAWACFCLQFLGVTVTTNMYLPEAPRITPPTTRPPPGLPGPFFRTLVGGQLVALFCVRLLILRTVFNYIHTISCHV